MKGEEPGSGDSKPALLLLEELLVLLVPSVIVQKRGLIMR